MSATQMGVEAKLDTKTLEAEKAGEHCFHACNYVLGVLLW
jgi:hypothetical protein